MGGEEKWNGKIGGTEKLTFLAESKNIGRCTRNEVQYSRAESWELRRLNILIIFIPFLPFKQLVDYFQASAACIDRFGRGSIKIAKHDQIALLAPRIDDQASVKICFTKNSGLLLFCIHSPGWRLTHNTYPFFWFSKLDDCSFFTTKRILKIIINH